jgi:hypothetical protein
VCHEATRPFVLSTSGPNRRSVPDMGQWNAVIIGGVFIYLVAEPLFEYATNKVDDWKRRRVRRRADRPD